MTEPTVSVIVPTYNYGHYLGTCIESVLSQSHKDFEILVIDDASDDDTEAVVSGFADSRIRYERNSTRIGHTKTFNSGLRLAQGRYVSILSADDFLCGDDSLERRVRFLEHRPDYGVVFGSGVYVDEGGRPLSSQQPASPDPGEMDDDLPALMLERNLVDLSPLVFPCSELVRRHCYDKVGCYDEELCAYEDFDLWLRMAATVRFGYIPDRLVCKRTHGASQTHRNVENSRAYKDLETLHRRAFERYPAETEKYNFRKLLARNYLRVFAAELHRPGDLWQRRSQYMRGLSTYWPVLWDKTNLRVLAKAAYLAAGRAPRRGQAAR